MIKNKIFGKTIEKNQEKERTVNEGNAQFQNTIKDFGSAIGENARERFFCINIIGQIEGHNLLDGSQKATKYDHLIPLLFSLEESDGIDGILILLNTLGGDVEAGLAIAEVIASLRKPTVSIVLGGGHSIGVPLAVAAKRSFIVESATMTIHPVRTSGLVLGVYQSFDYLEKMQNRILRFIVNHSHIEEGALRDMMLRTDILANDIGSVLEGRAAVECGLIDEVGGLDRALDALRAMRNQNEPPK